MHINLEERKQFFNECMRDYKVRIIICGGTGCIANGSMNIYNRFIEIINQKGYAITVSLKKEKADFILSQSGCQGFCQMGPLISIYPQGILYTKVSVDDVDEIVEKTILRGEHIDRLLYRTPTGEPVCIKSEIPFYARQQRIMLKLCGNIDANDLDEYIGNDGYSMAHKALFEMSDEAICKEIMDSGLRGRGGGGFPTGRKWDLTRKNLSDIKYVICNGDEGDPGAFMDRCVMEGNPHSVLEGMIIAAKAIGASIGYVYVRTEYPLAVERLKTAVKNAEAAGILGENILGSGMKFVVYIMEGAGAFVCGEETALMSSIEGKRGMPSPKPPFPAEKGLFGKPTLINNVETLSTVPLIMRIGAEEYAKLGTKTAKGTKTFALTGHVANTGLIEVPFGATLREIIYDIGGGVIDDNGNLTNDEFKAVQIGGPSGGCLTPAHLDLPLDYETLQTVGAMVGSGGLVVMNKQTCMIKIARFFMQFTQNESCGKCVVCREGTRQMLALLDDIIEARATNETLELLEELATTVKIGSLCALGKTAPNPILSTLRYFRDEYNAHVFGGYCPSNNCDAFKKYTIDALKCKSCSLCSKKCPTGAISGERGVPYVIDASKCIKCGACVLSCKFNAVAVG
ncbi:MAG: 4Fe-4S binding protein [Christensenellaceae bacterium]|jgi:NADH-quinone oxidoreductase subunit F|nr:4Fe-4S binding protein [Christensenellaceae bacterium]